MLFGLCSCDISEDDINNAINIISEVDEILGDSPASTEAVTTATETTTTTTEIITSVITEKAFSEYTTEATEEFSYDEVVSEASTETAEPETEEAAIDYDGVYTSKDDVALYIYIYGELPKNFISKNEARDLGWEGGSLEPYAPGMCIGGSHFGNYEGLLPEKDGRKYTECDIDTLGKKSRGAKRIVFSNDGLIYYTEDHYESFELLYGEE